MKRDMNLVRKILLEVEANTDGSTPLMTVSVENYSQDQIQYHLAILIDAGLIEAIDTSSASGIGYYPTRLTWEGHEFLDAARSETIWKKAMSSLSKVSESIALPILKELLLSEMRSQLGI